MNGEKFLPKNSKTGIAVPILVNKFESKLDKKKNPNRNLLVKNILVINFFVSIIPLAFIISWFCKKNSGSILGAILIHSIVNLSQEFFLVSPYTKCIQTLILIVIAAIFIIVDRNVFFGDAEKVNIERRL